MPAVETANLTYRLFREDDLPSLLRLWEEAGWGTLTAEQWRTWYADTPYGACLITVGVDSRGEVAAQEIFTPTRVCVGGDVVRALRLSAPIIRGDMRRESLRSVDHPVIGLFLTAAEAAAAQGYAIIYALPEHGWLPFFRWGPRLGLPRFDEAEYACVSLPVHARRASGATMRDLTARPAVEFGEEYVSLWREARETFPIACGVMRDPMWLCFRNGGRVTLEVRDSSGALVGYSATMRKNALIADLLARRPEDLPDVLAATLGWFAAAESAHESPEFESLKLMATPALRAALGDFDVTPEDYKFAFVCHQLDDTIPADSIAPERWYVMPGD